VQQARRCCHSGKPIILSKEPIPIGLPTLPSTLERRLQNPFSFLAKGTGSKSPVFDSFETLEGSLARYLGRGGQKIRARLAWQAARSMNLDEQTGMALACCCEWLHNASLIHDDIQDGDTIRRNAPALWVEVGVGPAICIGDALISAAYGVLRDVQVAPTQLRVLLEWVEEAISQTIAGQLADLAARRTPVTCLAQYEAVAARKSGPLLGLPLALVLLAADATADSKIVAVTASAAMTDLGVAYQLLDDLGDWNLDQRDDGRHVLNAVLVERVRWPVADAMASVARRVRELLQKARERATELPLPIQSLIFWLADHLEHPLNAG
jgi:geranylgeranyl diphosphate synthase type II